MPMAKKAPLHDASKGKSAKQDAEARKQRPDARRKGAGSQETPRAALRSVRRDDEGDGVDMPGSQRPPADS